MFSPFIFIIKMEGGDYYEQKRIFILYNYFIIICVNFIIFHINLYFDLQNKIKKHLISTFVDFGCFAINLGIHLITTFHDVSFFIV